ncbi:MAG: pirin family protein [Thermoplasmata archaeon]
MEALQGSGSAVAVRVVPGEILSKDATTRAVVPSAAVPRWAPFERVAESIATPRRRFPPHRHESVEVLTYVIEGSGTYDYGSGPSTPLLAGSVNLLTAATSVTHGINPGKGQTIRYFAVIVTLPAVASSQPRMQSARPEPPSPQPDGTVGRTLVGHGKALVSAVGLECEAIEFRSAGTTFRKVGHDRVAIGYAVSGIGKVDNQALEAGEAALVDDAAGIAITGRAGLRLILTSAPRPP